MTYKQAYDKIIDAYFKDEIQPFNPSFCFCGTLCNNSPKWYGYTGQQHFNSDGYIGRDFVRMESALLHTLSVECGFNKNDWQRVCLSNKNYEDALFAGMSAALDVLKQIHIERGEVIDEVPVFNKRELVAK